MRPDLARWMALAWRTPMTAAQRLEIVQGAGPEALEFPTEILAREEEDLGALEELGATVLTLHDERYPQCLRALEDPPLLLLVAGRPELLEEEGVTFTAGARGRAGEELQEALDSGSRAVVVLSKGLLRAQALLQGLAEPIADGSLALVSAEPPRASWGPMRDRRRDVLYRALTGKPR